MDHLSKNIIDNFFDIKHRNDFFCLFHFPFLNQWHRAFWDEVKDEEEKLDERR